MDPLEMAGQMPADFDPDDITPADSPLRLMDVITSPVYGDLFTPTVAVGEPAFDFDLHRLDSGGDTVRLSDYAGHQRVALIFGSYT